MMTETARTYPTPAAMAERWTALAAAIAQASQEPRSEDGPRGNLVVLGSGLAHVDLTIDTEPEVRSADHVFYCIYDRVTQVWLNRLRPDAYDLTLLYDPGIDRYYTYMRMAEALLYYVRQGKKVVAIYYGHPGIFAMPAHRAIAIARSEGHRARMRPGISALDHLVADVGFDPALPGLLSFEATDMLLRQRRIDPSLHLVIWQVGVVGEFGFDPGGFGNRGYDLLVAALERVYPPEWEVTHYIAPQYIGLDPLMERHPIGGLRDPQVRARINPLSTFYIEPYLAIATDPEQSVNLGLTRRDQNVHPPTRRYQNNGYGEQELAAVRSFAEFAPSVHYSLPRATPGVDFLLALSREPALQERYHRDAAEVLADARFADLSDRSRRLLAMAHPLAINKCIAEEAARQLEARS